jgi:hypothetical protein
MLGDVEEIVGDMTGVQRGDPKLDVLADHGGFVRTHALLAGSPCLDTGTTDPLASAVDDARGFPRALWDPSLGPADIGAYEEGGAVSFRLATSPRTPLPTGAAFAITVGGGIHAEPFVTAAVDVAGTATFVPLFMGRFDRTGISYVPGDVPPGLSGLSVTLRCYSIDASDRVVATNDDTIAFL